MAAYEESTEFAERKVVRLRLPSNGAELEKALVRAVDVYREAKGNPIYDDAVTVEADETEIRLVVSVTDWAPRK